MLGILAMVVGVALLFFFWRGVDSSLGAAGTEGVKARIRGNPTLLLAGLGSLALGAITYIVFSIRERRSAEPPAEGPWN